MKASSFSVFRKHILCLTSPASDMYSSLRSDLPSCFGGMLTSSSYKHELQKKNRYKLEKTTYGSVRCRIDWERGDNDKDSEVKARTLPCLLVH